MSFHFYVNDKCLKFEASPNNIRWHAGSVDVPGDAGNVKAGWFEVRGWRWKPTSWWRAAHMQVLNVVCVLTRPSFVWIWSGHKSEHGLKWDTRLNKAQWRSQKTRTLGDFWRVCFVPQENDPQHGAPHEDRSVWNLCYIIFKAVWISLPEVCISPWPPENWSGSMTESCGHTMILHLRRAGA